MSEDKDAFLQNFQKSAYSSAINAAGLQRRRLVHLHDYSKRSLDEQSTHYLLEKNLQEYAETMDNDDRLNNKLKSLLVNANISGPVKLQSGLQNINFRKILKPLPCYEPNTFKCPASEANLREDFSAFMASLPKKPTMSKTQHLSTKKPLDDFRTATDELRAQSLMGKGQKRKVGLSKRSVNCKFVPPVVLNRNESSDGSSSTKSEDWTAENVDERLKSIDPKMIELIRNEIMDIGTLIQWDDIAGLEFAKNAIKEAVVWPMLRPDIFRGLRRPPKGILLFGPPGTGKTLIGKCVAAQSKSTFFSISASSLTSKWIGDGEKMVRALFAVARVHQPAVIFIDEVDSLLTQRSETEHESSRRLKTEFLVELDGAATDAEERLLIIGATNRPQELDEAARRRFTKRLYIPLPECEARLQLVKRLICEEKHCLTEGDCKEVAQLSDGYSGADIRNLCSEAALGPIRNLDPSLMEHIRAEDVRPLAIEDFLNAFRRIRSSVAPKDLDQYVLWDSTYGSGL